MPIGSFSFQPPSLPLTLFPAIAGVFLYNAGADVTQEENLYTYLPNILCDEIQYKEGNDPPTARFHYIIDNRNPLFGFPSQFEELWPLNRIASTDSYVVTPDSRISVLVQLQDNSITLLFDGYARLPTTQLDEGTQHVGFTAVGVSIRCWDTPIGGRVQRQGDKWDSLDDEDQISTHLPTIFNPSDTKYPSGLPNCTGLNLDVHEGEADISFPVFIEPLLTTTDGPDVRNSYWTLSKAVRYLLSIYNNGEFVENPDFTDLTALLDNRRPIGSVYDPDDSSTYEDHPVVIRTFDCTNHGWPDAVERLLGYHGFGMRWISGIEYNVRDITAVPNPVNKMIFYRKDSGNTTAPKQVSLALYGATIDPGSSNINAMTAGFDYHGIANEFSIETALKRYEISVILAPDFTPTVGDETATNRKQFLKANLDSATQDIQSRYRRYIVDELGEGHWDLVGNVHSDDAFSFGAVFEPVFIGGGVGVQEIYAKRLRPGLHRIFSTKGPLSSDKQTAQLAFSRDYTGAAPLMYDAEKDTAHWQPIEDGWKLLDDRLGIEITSEDVENWHIGKYTGANPQEKSSTLRGISSIANPHDTGGNKGSFSKFFLRLTVVVESDETLEFETTAFKRPASPIKNAISRRIDAKDHWRYDVVHRSSVYWQQTFDALTATLGAGNVPQDANQGIIVQDDHEAVEDHASQLRTAHEFPAMPTAFTIPMITLAYSIGDRIDLITGRNVSLQNNVAKASGEAASYSFIVGISFHFAGEQKTVLQLSDRRLEPGPIQSRQWGGNWWKGAT